MSDSYDPREDYRPIGAADFFDAYIAATGGAEAWARRFDDIMCHTNIPPALAGLNARRDREA